MELKDICVDLELAKQLEEKGFPQDGLFGFLIKHEFKFVQVDLYPSCSRISAPTTDELLKELPEYFGCDKSESILFFKMRRDHELYVYEYGDNHAIYYITSDLKNCNSLAKMWLSLKENNLLEGK